MMCDETLVVYQILRPHLTEKEPVLFDENSNFSVPASEIPVVEENFVA